MVKSKNGTRSRKETFFVFVFCVSHARMGTLLFWRRRTNFYQKRKISDAVKDNWGDKTDRLYRRDINMASDIVLLLFIRRTLGLWSYHDVNWRVENTVLHIQVLPSWLDTARGSRCDRSESGRRRATAILPVCYTSPRPPKLKKPLLYIVAASFGRFHLYSVGNGEHNKQNRSHPKRSSYYQNISWYP